MAEFDIFRFSSARGADIRPDEAPGWRSGAARLLVVSDSHGDQAGLAAALKSSGGRTADLVVHLGDGLADLSAVLGGLKRPPDFDFVCGSGEEPLERQAPRLIEAGGAKILLLHGHQVRESYGGLLSAARAFGAGIVLFGHTHQAVFETIDGVLLVNPGSLGKPKKPGFPTCAVLKVEGGRGEVAFFAARPGLFGPRMEPWQHAL